MAHVDLGDWRVDHVVPLKDWRRTTPTPAHYGFFIVSSPPEDWETQGVKVKRRIGLFTREDLTSDLAVGIYAMPGTNWREFSCTGTGIMMRYFTEPRPI